jgi:hypothetical protein
MPNEPWAFSYIIEKHEDHEITVMTKLSSKLDPKNGRILYGLSVKRIRDDKYVIWSDYENRSINNQSPRIIEHSFLRIKPPSVKVRH